jgi:CheY-like chemotaxis protein
MAERAGGGLILVVDDDRDVRDSFVDVLTSSGYRALGAANGQLALDYLRTAAPPSVILLDLMMPVMDGFRFRAEQLKTPELAAVPVVLITADGNPAPQAASLGVADSLRKPVELDALLKVVARYVPGVGGEPA